MANRSNIDHIVKQGFESINKKAPADAWKNMSAKLDMPDFDAKIDEQIKNSFEQQSNYAPEDVWENVNRQLTIDDSWRKIKSTLDKRVILFWSRIAAAILIAIIVLYKVSSDFNTNILSDATPASSFNRESEIRNIQQFTSIDDIIPESENISSNSVYQNYDPVVIESNDQFVQTTDIVDNINDKNLQKVDRPYNENIEILKNKRPQLLNIKHEGKLPNLHDTIAVDYYSEDNKKHHRYEIGVTYSLHNTWLLNNETRESFDNASLVNTHASYTNNYGLLFTYFINENNAITSELYTHGMIKQHYETYIEGKYYRKDIELHYSQLAVMYNYDLALYSRRPSAYSFKTGLYISNFNKKQSSLGEDLVQELSDFSSLDYGLKLSVGHKNYFNRFAFEYGFNSEYGLKNIFVGNESTPSDFNETHPFHIGAYLNLLYSF